MNCATMQKRPLRVSFGPAMSGWGSWDWLGADTAAELRRYFLTSTFSWGEFPDCDVAVVIKHLLPPAAMVRLAARAAIVYCPVDFYGDGQAIVQDAAILRQCTTIVVHCERLRPWFAPYAAVEYVDHHLKYIGDAVAAHRTDGHVLWVGVRSNLEPLVEWVNASQFDEPLHVLTNFENPCQPLRPVDIGFRSGHVTVENWTPAAHLRALREAKAALDIKGSDFRQAHKPPTKALDFLASGLPLAMNGSNSVEHLEQMGFEVVSPLDRRRWFSHEYWQDTANFGLALRELLSLRRVGLRWRRFVCQALRRQQESAEAAGGGRTECGESNALLHTVD